MGCGKDTINPRMTLSPRYNLRMPCICIVPVVEGIGGMAAFRRKFEAGLTRRGMKITHDPAGNCDAVLVIAGTRHILPLWQARRRGVRILQRLDGINWIHKRRRTGMRHFVRAEYGNLILSFIRARVATRILYQSEFTRRWWNDVVRNQAAAILRRAQWRGPRRISAVRPRRTPHGSPSRPGRGGQPGWRLRHGTGKRHGSGRKTPGRTRAADGGHCRRKGG